MVIKGLWEEYHGKFSTYYSVKAARTIMTTFSKRHGHSPSEPDISIREDAPEELRGIVVDIAYESGLSPHGVRSIVCRVLRRREDPGNWSAYPNVNGEARDYVDSCEWYEVYDIIEALYARVENPDTFQSEMNAYFRKRGIGWHLAEGLIRTRGEEAFEKNIRSACDELESSHRSTAAREIHEALHDLSRRPTPDITGSIQHALAALECVARDVSGDPKATLGSVIKNNPGLIPPPLDTAVDKLWGYASEQGRHLREGREPGRDEAILCVHVAAVVAEYLSRKASQ